MLSVLQKLKEQGILSQGDYYFAKLIADKQCHTDYAEPVKNLAILLAALCSWRYTQGNTCSQLDRYLEHNLFGLARSRQSNCANGISIWRIVFLSHLAR